ncbi:MAG: GntR family transcriptional regulator [Patulibacter sp.]
MSAESSNAISRTGNSFSDQAERTLRDQILHGAFPPGGRLNEVEIATDLGVSRGPVREAMQRLARDGLVVLQPHRGAFVRRLTVDEVSNLFEVRITLERKVAALAAERLTPVQQEQLEQLRAGMAAQDEDIDPDDQFQGTHDIHALLAIASGNEALAAHVATVNRELLLLRTQSGQTQTRAHDAIDEHAELIAAVLSRDPEAAATAMDEHLSKALNYALQAMAAADNQRVDAL